MQLRVLKQPLTGAYLSFFLMLTLMIMVGATWMGLYLAKRITRPVQMLVGGRARDRRGASRSPPRAGDRRRVRVARRGLQQHGRRARGQPPEAGAVRPTTCERKHLEVEGRRRYIETVLERIATGVISVDARGRGQHDQRRGRAAARARAPTRPAVRRTRCSRGATSRRCSTLLRAGRARGAPSRRAQEIALMRDGREMHLAAVASALHGESGAAEGAVLVFDDVTPLIRSQKVAAWREVARRLAHEIKNPLTPIQLSAERLRRHFGRRPPATQALVDECTTHHRGEVESLKGLVDEFSQFARMPAPRAVPTDLHALLDDTLALYDGLFSRRCDSSGDYDPRAARSCGSIPSRSSGSSSTWSTTRSRRWSRSGTITIETAARPVEQPRAARRSPTTAPASRRRTVTSCSCRTTRPSGAAAASVSHRPPDRRRARRQHRECGDERAAVARGSRLSLPVRSSCDRAPTGRPNGADGPSEARATVGPSG